MKVLKFPGVGQEKNTAKGDDLLKRFVYVLLIPDRQRMIEEFEILKKDIFDYTEKL